LLVASVVTFFTFLVSRSVFRASVSAFVSELFSYLVLISPSVYVVSVNIALAGTAVSTANQFTLSASSTFQLPSVS